jgi:hypothetical protein
VRVRSLSWWVVRGSWLLTAAAVVALFLSGADPASTILIGTALALAVPAAACVGGAMDARGTSERLVWVGRVLALFGAGVAIAFPAMLYGELVALAADPTHGGEEQLPRGIAYTAALMPLTIVPAVLALRWTRLGGLLLLLNAFVAVLGNVYDPFHAFPDRDVMGGLVFDALPRLLTAAFLIAGGAGPAGQGPPRRRTTGPISRVGADTRVA